MNEQAFVEKYGEIAVDALGVINIINKELQANNILNLNHQLFISSSYLSKDILLSKEDIIKITIEKISKALMKYSQTFKVIAEESRYSNIYLFINLYMKEILKYYDTLMITNNDKFDDYVSLEGRMPSKKEIQEKDLLMSIEDIQNTMSLLNEAVRIYYELFYKKILIATFTDSQMIEFKIQESKLAHLLGLNLIKIVTNPKYVDIFRITPFEKECILDRTLDPLGEASISLLHKITDISSGNLLQYEEDRLKKLHNYDYKYVDYNDKLAELQHYSKINMKSKAFINFNPLEKLSLALNFPEGYELIYARKKRVEKGEVEPAQHSLLLSENRISDVYKFSSLIANYDKTEDRRYFMSLFLKKPEEMNDLMKVAVPSITTSVRLEGENGGEVPIYREFSVEEQLEFLTRVQNEFYNLNINELLEYFKGLVGGYNKK